MMRNGLTVALACLFAWCGFGQSTPAANSESSDMREVREVMQQFSTAVDHSDLAALERLWMPDYLWVNPGGRVLTKEQRLDLVRSGKMKTESYTVDEENIRTYGNTAIVIYRSTVKGQYSGKDVPPQRRVTTVLLKQDGRWQIVSQQSTEIYHPPAAQ